jgi:hypothetical protein
MDRSTYVAVQPTSWILFLSIPTYFIQSITYSDIYVSTLLASAHKAATDSQQYIELTKNNVQQSDTWTLSKAASLSQ